MVWFKTLFQRKDHNGEYHIGKNLPNIYTEDPIPVGGMGIVTKLA